MIEVLHQQTPDEFLKKCGPFLQEKEAEHNLLLSLCQAAKDKAKQGGKVEAYFSALCDAEGPIVVSACMPSRNLILSSARGLEIEKLAQDLARNNMRFPGIMGPSDVAAAFANAWTELTGQKSVEYMDQIIYSLTKIVMPPAIPGELRLARMGEKKTITRWLAAFAKDALPKTDHLSEAQAEKRADEMIKNCRVYVWAVGGKPVAQAIAAGTDKVARIGGVYTPPEARGMGYASAVVAHLSAVLLGEGRSMCCLYADARNPVSNSIYRKIGYEFVGRSSLYVLEAV